jgi:hypothetical protein
MGCHGPVHYSTVVPAIRSKSGTDPVHKFLTGLFASIRQPVSFCVTM